MGARSAHHQVLPVPVGLLLVLLEAGHEPVPGRDLVGDVGVVDLIQQPELAGDGVAHLGDLVARAADLDEVLVLNLILEARGLELLLLLELGRVVRIARGATGEVGLVLLALRVGQVRAFVGVERQAEPALEPAEVVPENIGVLQASHQLEFSLRQRGARSRGESARWANLSEVYRLEREFTKALSPVNSRFRRSGDSSSSEFAADSVLSVHAKRTGQHHPRRNGRGGGVRGLSPNLLIWTRFNRSLATHLGDMRVTARLPILVVQAKH